MIRIPQVLRKCAIEEAFTNLLEAWQESDIVRSSDKPLCQDVEGMSTISMEISENKELRVLFNDSEAIPLVKYGDKFYRLIEPAFAVEQASPP